MVPLPTARNVVKRRTAATEGAKITAAPLRLEKDALENALMGLFERRNLWTFKQLVEDLVPLRCGQGVLSELAVLNRRGPNTGMWTLKDMYKRRGAIRQVSSRRLLES